MIAYIDGFNLYWGLRDAYQHRYLWLDLEKLTLSMLRPGQRLMVVRYFTARTRDDPAGGARQSRLSRGALLVRPGRDHALP